MGKKVKVKKPCCGSRPRCKQCPVVWKRLEAEGLAERAGKRTWRAGKIPEAVLKLVRHSA